MINVIIAGGRDFTDYPKLKESCDAILSDIKDDITIISGDARGADKFGILYASDKGYPVQHFPADWNTHGKKAGILRNVEMSKIGDILIAFYDGSSNGTGHMIRVSRQRRLQVYVISY